MSGKWNSRHSAVRRIQQELKELRASDDPDIVAEAIEENIFEWHFAIRGAWDTEFEGGIYHGRILMPAEYPFKPPAFVMLTPSGRFETGVKICLSISSHHPESWQPSWSVRSALVALIAFMQTPGNGALGSLDHPVEVRRQLAAESRVAPPAYGSEERRELLRELHQRMLDMEERSRALCSSERAADAGPDSTPAAQSPDASAQPDEAAAAAGAEASSSAAAAAASGAVSEQQVQPAAEEAAGPVPLSVLQPPVTAASSLLAAALPAAAPPPPAPALATPAESELRQRVAAVAAAAAASPPPVPAPLPPLAVAHMAGPPQVLHADHSWEDRGLTYLAVVLALCIAALVVRKVFVAFSFSSDDLYNFNHVEGVDL